MREEVKRWWEQAQDDLEKAQILFDNEKYDGAAFFCQQAVEKALKSLYLKQKNKIKKIHDLVRLGRDVSLPSNLLQFSKELTQAYIYYRYPDIAKVKSIRSIAEDFLRNTKEVLKWVKEKL